MNMMLTRPSTSSGTEYPTANPEKRGARAVADFTLVRSHGFYDLEAKSHAARQFLLTVPKQMVVEHSVLLDSFFANAGDWVRCHVMPTGLSVQWGYALYQGEKGAAALWDECAFLHAS